MTHVSNSFVQHGHFRHKSKSKVRVRAHKTTRFKRHVQKKEKKSQKKLQLWVNRNATVANMMESLHLYYYRVVSGALYAIVFFLGGFYCLKFHSVLFSSSSSPLVCEQLINLFSFFHFIRRFWNQIFIWRSVRHSACAISMRRLRVRYLLKWNSFSNSNVW